MNKRPDPQTPDPILKDSEIENTERLHVQHDTGEITGVSRWVPDVLPLAGLDFERLNWPHLYVFALKTKGGD